MEILVARNPPGTRFHVHRAAELRSLPAGWAGKVLAPGEAGFGRTYEEWREHVGGTVELPPRPAPVSPPEPPYVPPLVDGHWREEPEVEGEPVPDQPYGYHTGTRAVPCSPETLLLRLFNDPSTPRVWTPAAPGLVFPEEVPFLRDGWRERTIDEARRITLRGAAAFAAGCAAVALVPWEGLRRPMLFGLALGAAWLASQGYEWREAVRHGNEAFPRARTAQRHSLWMWRHPPHAALTVAGVLLVVGIAQLLGGSSIEAAGLVKEATRDGEWWRLLTAPLLHGSMLHFNFNVWAFLALAQLLIAHARWPWVFIVFVASALGGSVLSVCLLEATSVGASGGVMGVMGFLVALAWLDPRALPEQERSALLGWLLAVAALGAVGFVLIDNAAHLGGFLSGALLAAVFHRREDRERPTPWEVAAGCAALALLLAGAGQAVRAIVG